MIVHQNKAERLLQALQTEIESLPEGARLRSVRQIMTHYQVSQSTAVQALDKLERSGWILRRPGKGIFSYGSGNKQERRIALLTPDWPSSVYIELETQLHQQSRERKISVQRLTFPFESDNIFRYLIVGEFDAVLVIKDTQLSLDDIQRITLCPVPILFIGSSYYEIAINYITTEPLKNGILAADYLIRNGHRKIAALITEPHNSIIRRRVDGFRMIAESHDVEVQLLDVGTRNGESSVARSFEFISRYLDENRPDFTALYLLSDAPVGAVISAIVNHGYRIPDDISLIGADGSSDGAYVLPPLTTVDLSFDYYISRILDAIDELTANRGKGVQLELPPVVIERNSVKKISRERS